jgi:hypothetical protein
MSEVAGLIMTDPHILNTTCPASARQACVFVPICRNVYKDALDFNYQVFEEDKQIVERRYNP